VIGIEFGLFIIKVNVYVRDSTLEGERNLELLRTPSYWSNWPDAEPTIFPNNNMRPKQRHRQSLSFFLRISVEMDFEG
jgi:hypothetical protein